MQSFAVSHPTREGFFREDVHKILLSKIRGVYSFSV